MGVKLAARPAAKSEQGVTDYEFTGVNVLRNF